MSVSMSQASDARIFLTSYNNSIQTLKLIAQQEIQQQKYQNFLSRVIEAKNKHHFVGTQLIKQDLVNQKQTLAFQLSHAYFSQKFGCLHQNNQTFKDMLNCLQNNIKM